MTRVANIFRDPKGLVADYPWAINHDSEDPTGRSRTIAATAPTAGIGLVRQQGVDTPQIKVVKGTILLEAQRIAFIQWWALCASQSIYFVEFSGDIFEVMITDYGEQKVAVQANLNDPTIPYHIYNYTLTMDVLTVVSGAWTNAPNP